MEESWVQDLLRQSKEQRVRFFFKQWGGVNKKAAGRQLNGRTYDELPILQ
jgi:protein gp37